MIIVADKDTTRTSTPFLVAVRNYQHDVNFPFSEFDTITCQGALQDITLI